MFKFITYQRNTTVNIRVSAVVLKLPGKDCQTLAHCYNRVITGTFPVVSRGFPGNARKGIIHILAR